MAQRAAESDSEAEEDGAAQSDSDDDDWGDPRWRDAIKAKVKDQRQRLEAQDAELARLRAQLEAKAGVERELERLRYAAEDLSEVRESCAKLRAKSEQLVKERDRAKQREAEVLSSRHELDQALGLARKEVEGLKVKLARTTKEVEWEKMFRAGQEKAKDKLSKAIIQLEHDLQQQRQYTGNAQEKLRLEEKDVERERAQRLLDVHKIKLAEDARDEFKALAHEKALAAAAAIRNEEHMRALVDPLRNSLKANQELLEEDAAAIAALETELEQLRLEHSELQTRAEESETEARLLRARLGRQDAMLSRLRAELFRLIKCNPDLAAHLSPELQLGPLMRQLQRRRSSAAGAAGAAPPLPSLNAAEVTEGGEPQDSHAWKFALFLEECAEELELEFRPQGLWERGARGGASLEPEPDPSPAAGQQRQQEQEQQQQQQQRRQRRRRRLRKLQAVPGDGSAFVGRGLGLRKPSGSGSKVCNPAGQDHHRSGQDHV